MSSYQNNSELNSIKYRLHGVMIQLKQSRLVKNKDYSDAAIADFRALISSATPYNLQESMFQQFIASECRTKNGKLCEDTFNHWIAIDRASYFIYAAGQFLERYLDIADGVHVSYQPGRRGGGRDGQTGGRFMVQSRAEYTSYVEAKASSSSSGARNDGDRRQQRNGDKRQPRPPRSQARDGAMKTCAFVSTATDVGTGTNRVKILKRATDSPMVQPTPVNSPAPVPVVTAAVVATTVSTLVLDAEAMGAITKTHSEQSRSWADISQEGEGTTAD